MLADDVDNSPFKSSLLIHVAGEVVGCGGYGIGVLHGHGVLGWQLCVVVLLLCRHRQLLEQSELMKSSE